MIDRPRGRSSRAFLSLMSTVIDSLERTQLRRVPRFQAGDRVKVHFQVIEGTRRRTQVFEGVVIKRQGEGVRETFTVRKQSFGVGVERTFPMHSPKIEKIEVAARGDVRRAKLYYLRGRVGKRARVRERRYTGPEEVVERGMLYDPAAEAAAAADAEVPGEAVDEQALAEAEVADTRRPRTLRRRPPVTSKQAREYKGVATKKGSSSASGSLLELIMIVAVALGLALGIQAFLVKPYRIPSESMVPTLADRPARAGQPHRRALHRRPTWATWWSSTRPPAPSRTTPAARASRPPASPATSRRPSAPTSTSSSAIVAGPGDKLRIDDGHVVLNGKLQKEPFAQPCGGGEGCDFPTEITIPAGLYFMMGDNRGSSDDSRFWGPVPEKWIIGQAFATYWPPKRIGLL